jgi:hypothetical protein
MVAAGFILQWRHAREDQGVRTLASLIAER